MPLINLLPWREQLREERKREFLFMLGGSVGLGILVVVLIHGVMSNRIQSQKQVNAYLNREMIAMDTRIAEVKTVKAQRKKLLSRIQLIERLQTNRPMTVQIFNQLVEIIPQGVYLVKVSRVDDKIIILGQARSDTVVTQLLRNIEGSHWLKNATLREIKHQGKADNHFRHFQIRMEENLPGENEVKL